MENATGVVKDHKNVIQTSGGTIASIALEQSGRRVAGALVTPATWALNHAADGSTPGAVDIGLWISGFFAAGACSGKRARQICTVY